MSYVPEAVVYHHHCLRPSTFWRQHFGYGRGASHYHRARSRRLDDKSRIEPFGFYLGLVAYPMRGKTGRRPLILSALLALSQVANAAGYFWERAHRVAPGR